MPGGPGGPPRRRRRAARARTPHPPQQLGTVASEFGHVARGVLDGQLDVPLPREVDPVTGPQGTGEGRRGGGHAQNAGGATNVDGTLSQASGA